MKHAIILTAVLAMAVSVVYAQQETSVPPLINYQGMLADANGNPMTGTKKLTFNIYDAATGGNLVWGPQVFDSVPLINGRFNVILGSTDKYGKLIIEAFGSNERYLGITVDGNPEIAPRQQVLSSPFAIQAEHAVNAANTELLQNKNLEQLADLFKKPDYDSGWFEALPFQKYDKQHNLGVLPMNAIMWGASDSLGNNMCTIDHHISTIGITYGSYLADITNNSYTVYTRDCPISSITFCSGYIRVLMWK